MINTKLKFIQSTKTGNWVSFVNINTETGRIKGVRENAPEPKKVCVASKKISGNIIRGVLYDVTMIPMEKPQNGYVVTEAEPCQFEAVISTTIVKNAVYMVEVKFGNKTVTYNPLDGKNNSVRTIAGVADILKGRKDIMNLEQVLHDFYRSANILLCHYLGDGYISSEKVYNNTRQATA